MAGSSKTQDFFDDLLDGLEASVFDANPFSSPAKSETPLKPSTAAAPPAKLRSPRSKPLSQNLANTPIATPTRKTIKHLAVEASPSRTTKQPTPSKAAVNKENQAAIADLLYDVDTWEDSALDLDNDLVLSSPVKDAAPVKRVPISRQYQRFVVLHVEEVEHPENHMPCKILKVAPDGPSTSKARNTAIYLQDEWTDTHVKEGDIVNIVNIVNIVSSSPVQGDIHLTRHNNEQFLIHHPDTLITATAVATSFPCPRKPLLQDRLRATSPTSEPLLYGNLLHELFQACVVKQDWSDELRRELAESMCSQENIIAAAWELNKPKSEIQAQVLERSASWPAWAAAYMSASPKPSGVLSDPRGSAKGPENSGKVCVSQVHDIEEDIWSPRLGMKGKVDVSVQARVVGKAASPSERGQTGVVAPFEIKTGRTVGVMEHRAQTMLYTLLMADRYGADQEVGTGLLYYTQQNQVIRVAQAQKELRGLIHSRNELARYASMRSDFSLARSKAAQQHSDDSGEAYDDTTVALRNSTPDMEDALLPAPIDEERTCKRCYAVDACMLYRKAIDPQPFASSAPSDEMTELFQRKTGHVTRAQADFFREWEHLLNQEERELVRYRKEIWTMSPEDRQSVGRCLSDMTIDLSFTGPGQETLTGAGHIHRFTYRFVRSSQPATPPSQRSWESGLSLLGGLIATGDPIVVSMSEPEILSLARGFVLELTPHSIVLGLDHELVGLACANRPWENSEVDGANLFRIDKDELSAGMGRTRDNLAHLFYAEGDHKRKQLIVDLAPPIFSTLPSDYASAEEQSLNLNIDQRAAIDKVLSAQDYALVLGMPGTGKTTTVSEIITALVRRGKSVLLTSYTHSAVDNILLKLKDKDVSMLRLGNPDKVLPCLLPYTLSNGGPITSVDDLEHRFMAPKVVATTALSINHPLFMKRHFDYCIVDEASQITLPTCLGPLRFADTFVLVGDHNQLPPLVRNPSARKSGLETSLFKRLCEARPAATVYLSYQYRMNADVMSLSNKLVYKGLMKGGTEEILRRTLQLPKASGVSTVLHARSDCSEAPSSCWVENVLDPSRNVIFLDTDQMSANETKQGHLVINEIEGSLVLQTTDLLTAAGVAPDEIGVISLYRQQIKLLSSKLSGQHPAVEILTADRSQGRDKECIIMSLVRSNDENKVGDLLRDWRRLNVCLTRARSKLIIFGSKRTLSHELADLFELLEEKKMFFSLPADALDAHDFTSKRRSCPDSLAPQTPSQGARKMVRRKI